MIKDNPNCRQGHGTVRLLGFTLLTGLVALLLIAPADTIQAQQSDTEDVPAIVIGGVGIVGGFPSGEFGDNVTNAGIGISGFMGYMIPNTPAIVGLESGYLIYGRERRSELFSQTIPDVRVGVVTNNSILSVNAFLRLQPQSGTLRPYVEGIIGFHYLFTSTTIEDLPLITGNDIELGSLKSPTGMIFRIVAFICLKINVMSIAAGVGLVDQPVHFRHHSLDGRSGQKLGQGTGIDGSQLIPATANQRLIGL